MREREAVGCGSPFRTIPPSRKEPARTAAPRAPRGHDLAAPTHPRPRAATPLLRLEPAAASALSRRDPDLRHLCSPQAGTATFNPRPRDAALTSHAASPPPHRAVKEKNLYGGYEWGQEERDGHGELAAVVAHAQRLCSAQHDRMSSTNACRPPLHTAAGLPRPTICRCPLRTT
ncbi:hypothetical protein BS78_04G323300 [Paspalum vaginatum]|nr:hypothetical protein BS78_04G323300 [Paspalum vaginatum]